MSPARESDATAVWVTSALLIIAILLCASLLVVTWNLGTQLVSTWLLVLFQILIALLIGLGIVAIAGSGFSWVLDHVLRTLDRAQDRYPRQAKQIRDRGPAFAAGALLLAQGIVMIADKSFGENRTRAMLVSLVLLLVFGVANELILTPSRATSLSGFALWAVGVLYLPAAILFLERWTWGEALVRLRELGTLTVATGGLVLISLALLPVLIKWRR